MPGYIEDRWMNKRPNPATGKRERTARWGQGLRYRVKGIPGVRDESFKTLDDAKNWLATAQTDSRRGVFVDPELGQILLADYFDTVYWPGVTVSLGTAETMEPKIRRHILPHLGHLALAVIDEDHLRIWVATLLKTLSPGTVGLVYEYLSGVLGSAVPKRISRNPCSTKGIRPKAPQVKARRFTKEQGIGVRAGLRPRSRIAFDLGVGSGQRQGEAFGFSPEDIDRESEELHVRRQLQVDRRGKFYFKLPKGDKERSVPLSPGLMHSLDEYQDDFKPVTVTLPWCGPGGPDSGELTIALLMTTRYGNPVTASSWNADAWKPALSHAGMIAPWDDSRGTSHYRAGWESARELGFHITRHTYASVQLQAGESIVALSQWLGHDDPAFTLRRYTHFMPDDGRRGRTAMDTWLSGGAVSAYEVVHPLVEQQRVSAGDVALLYLVATPTTGGWDVSLLRAPGERPLGSIHVAGRRPDRVIATAETWLRANAAALGGQIVEVKDVTVDYPAIATSAMALGRVILTADVAGDFVAALAA